MTPIEKVLAALPGAKPDPVSKARWLARCPAHEDSSPSLSVAEAADGKVLLHCFAGCTNASVLAATGLTWPDLFPEGRKGGKPPERPVSVGQLAFTKRLPNSFLADVCRIRNAPGGGAVEMPYLDADGNELFARERRSMTGKKRFWQPTGKSLRLYGIWRVEEFRTAGKDIILVEGESDCWSLWYHGLPAVGVPGAAAWKTVNAAFAAGWERVYLWQEPDSGGIGFVAAGVARLREFRGDLDIRVLSVADSKDPSALHQRHGPDTKEVVLKLMGDAPRLTAETMPPPVVPEPMFNLTDLGNAKRMLAAHGKDLRYFAPFKSWYAWDGRRWEQDITGEADRRAKKVPQLVLAEAAANPDPMSRAKLVQHATASESAKSLFATVQLARTEPGIIVSSDGWDVHEDLLNTTSKTISLADSISRTHRREDMITQLCPVEYDPDAKCPEWEKFLTGIFPADVNDPGAGGDMVLIEFIQRLLGLCITGRCEPILPICWGNGANGKTTLFTTVLGIMGKDYGMQAPHNFLMAKFNDSHPTDIADLYRKRMVIVSEIAGGRKLDAALVKALTGGERVRARRMMKDFFEFDPTHTLVLYTNHRPRIPESDDGIWRRVVLIPFLMRFWNPDRGETGPVHLERDDELPAKFQAERPGILAWLVRGARDYLRGGLRVPDSVRASTNEYRDEEDKTSQFLADCYTVSNANRNTLLKDVAACHDKWAEANNERKMTSRQLATELRSHGVKVDRGTGNQMTCFGLEPSDPAKNYSSLSDLDN